MKHIIIWILGALTSFPAYAQFPGLSLSSNNQQLIEDAIKGGMILLEQSYQLEDTTTHQRFGRYGKEEFGKSYSLAVKVNDGICITDRATRPWEYDENFSRYRDSHRPILYKTSYRELPDSLPANMLALDYSIQKHYENSTLCFAMDSISFRRNGFITDETSGERNGWIVWVSSTSKLGECDSSTAFDYIIYKLSLNVSADSISYPVSTPQTDKHIWGGIFVIPEQSAIGQLTFRLCGIAEPNNASWQLIVPFCTASSAEQQHPVGEELTPTIAPPQEDKESDDVVADKKKEKKKNKKR